MSTDEAVARQLEQVQPTLPPASTWRPLARRAAVYGLPAIYVVALTATTLAYGLPIARDQMFFWLGLGLVAFSVGSWRSWPTLLVDWLPFLGLLVLYDFLRGAVSVTPQQAFVMPQLDLDRFLGAGTVPTVWLQQHLWDTWHAHWYDYAVWAVYLSHFFVVWIVAAVLWRVARHRFRRYALLVILLTLAAFLTYWLYPAQPPWLAGDLSLMPPVDRIVPDIWGRLGVTTAASVWENGSLVNTVAAMPSLHASYPFLLLLFFWPAGWWVRIGLGLYTLAMAFALVYGGEHFITDILVGWAMTLAIFLSVTAILNRRARAAPSPPPAPGSR